MSRLVKWPLTFLGGTLALIFISSLILNFVTAPALEKKYSVKPSGIAVSKDPATVARGKYLVHTVAGCAHCHGDDLTGKELNNDLFVGRIYSDNLTPGAGGVGKHLTSEDWAKIIRHGVSKSGHAVRFMPSQSFNNLSKPDLTAMVSYLVQLEPINKEHARNKIGPVARGLYVAGVLPVLIPPELIDHNKDFEPYVAPGPNAAYGKYLVEIGGCRDCHGSDLKGRSSRIAPPGTPPAPDITFTGTANEWKKDKFIKVMNTGQVTKTEKLNTWMPWEYLGKMTDNDLSAIYLYLRSVK